MIHDRLPCVPLERFGITSALIVLSPPMIRVLPADKKLAKEFNESRTKFWSFHATSAASAVAPGFITKCALRSSRTRRCNNIPSVPNGTCFSRHCERSEAIFINKFIWLKIASSLRSSQ
jgi:hypothetical protein